LPQWNCPNGIAPMELPQWNCPNGIVVYQVADKGHKLSCSINELGYSTLH
jgi:hypothetical protein